MKENVFFGVDYYPEHWSVSRLEYDTDFMRDMGIQIVRMAEFSWVSMEPAKGEYHFEWLEKAINVLGSKGIVTILGTPTAAPPAWIIEENPDILPIDDKGLQKGFGGRHHDCQSNENYRTHIKRFVSAMAEYFKDNEFVVGWQIDNEFGNGHGDLCYCNSCKEYFQRWLKDKYCTIEALNQAWGTYFWSQEYSDFKQIPVPKITPAGMNPSEQLDFKKFCSDLIVDFQKLQADIIRSKNSKWFITHNCMGFSDKVNYFDLSKDLDFITHDQYPGGFYLKMPHEDNMILSATLDLMRGIMGKPYWIMEQQAGMTGWDIMGRCPKPGQLSLWAQHSIAHGGDCIMFFRWRTCTVGQEQYWHGILPHNGIPGRRYYELKELIHNMTPIMQQLNGAMPKSKVAIVYSYEQRYSMQIQPHHPDLEYVSFITKYYKAFYDKNIPVDFVSDTAELSQYDIVIAPWQYLMNDRLEKHYRDYVKNGGRLVLTMRTGVKNDTNLCMDDMPLPGKLGEIAGIEINDYDCLRDCSIKVNVENINNDADSICSAYKWADIIDLKGAVSLADYAEDFYKGTPAITENKYESGIVYYVGCEPDERLMDIFAEYIISDTDIKPVIETGSGVEAAIRSKKNRDYIFVMNHNDREETINLPEEYSQIYGKSRDKLAPYEVAIFTK